MKKLSGVIIFLFCAFISFAQSPSFPNTNLNNSNASTIFGYLGGLTSNGYKLKYFVDTTAANAAPYLKYTPHVMIKCGDNIYVRSLALDRWLLVGGASTITVPVLFNGVDSITTPSAGVLCAWTGGLSNCFTVTTTVVPNYGVDSVVLTGSQLCYFVGATPTCYTVANVINNTTNIVNYIAQNNFNTFGIDSGSKLISGSVLIDNGFNGHTTTLYYKINGRYYTAVATTLFTITTSSVSSDRYTQAYVDTLGNFGLIDCPYGNPVPICGVDEQSQLIVATYYIPANSTTPQLVSNNDIYMEGVEWTMAGTARFNPLYTTLPFQGTYSLYDTAVTAGTYINFTYATPLNRSSFDYLSMQLKLRAVFNNNTKLVFSFYLNNSLVTQNSVQLNNGSYGYDRTIANAYQAIAIKLSDFQFYSGSFNRVRISFVGANTSGLQIDNFRLQAGGLNTGGNLVTDVNGQVGSVNLAIGDTLLHNADSSRIQLKDRRTGAILGSIPSYLSYVRSRDTCFVIDTVGMAATKEMWFSINPNCLGGGGRLTDSLFGRDDNTAEEDRVMNMNSKNFTLHSYNDYFLYSTQSNVRSTFGTSPYTSIITSEVLDGTKEKVTLKTEADGSNAYLNASGYLNNIENSYIHFGVNYLEFLSNTLHAQYPTTYTGGITLRTLPISVEVNGINHYSGTDGKIDLGTISGGSGGISELGTSDSTLSLVNDSTYKANIAILKTVWQARQDSLALVGAIALKKNSIDSVSGVATDYVTQYQRKKTSDSLLALILTKLSPADSVFLHNKLVSSFAKNAGGDSSILTLNDGTRYAVIDNNSGGGGSGTVTVVTASAPLSITSTPTTTPNVVADTTAATSTALVNQRQLGGKADSSLLIKYLFTGIKNDDQFKWDSTNSRVINFTPTATGVGDSLYFWKLNGNGIVRRDTGMFVGTIINSNLRFKTNNISRMVIDSINGFVGMGLAPTTYPSSQLHVNGPANLTNSQFRVGSFEVQNVAGVNNLLITDNAIYNSGFKRRQAGYASFIQSLGQEFLFNVSATSTAGSAITAIIPFKMNVDKTVALGGDIANTAATYSGSTMTVTSLGAQIGKNGVIPASSALLELYSSAGNKGLLLPRGSTSSIGAISAPAKGLMIYDTTLLVPKVYNGTVFESLSYSAPKIVGTANISASGDATVLSYTTGAADSTFNIQGRLNVTAISVVSVELRVTFTDETNTSRTVTFFQMGSTTSAIPATGNYNFPVLGEVRVKASTTITVSAVIIGSGTITYNAGASIIGIR